MPPNLSAKGPVFRGEFESFVSCEGKDTIRTDFILQNIFSYALRNTYAFDAVSAMNKKEEFVLKELKETFNAFQSNFGDAIRGLCREVEVTHDTIGSVIVGVANELFSEGITWSRIIALFAFMGELTLQCLSRKYPDSIVDGIYECFCRLVKEKLKCWVDDHGGWEGLTALSVTQQENTDSFESPKSANSGWAKSLFYSTVRMIGTLAHFANSSSTAFP